MYAIRSYYGHLGLARGTFGRYGEVPFAGQVDRRCLRPQREKQAEKQQSADQDGPAPALEKVKRSYNFV